MARKPGRGSGPWVDGGMGLVRGLAAGKTRGLAVSLDCGTRMLRRMFFSTFYVFFPIPPMMN